MHTTISFPMGKYFIVGFISVCIGCSDIMLFVKRLEVGGVCAAYVIKADLASLLERSSRAITKSRFLRLLWKANGL